MHKIEKHSHTSITGGENMTSKELLYLEDALGHEEFFKNKCYETASALQDENLRHCAEQMAQSHEQIFSSLYSLLHC